MRELTWRFHEAEIYLIKWGDMTYREIAESWASDYGIKAVLYAEEIGGRTPEDLGWDLDFVWTGWDSYDEVGGHAAPGYKPIDTYANDQFVSCWYLGTRAISEESLEIVITLEREPCESCDTDGCKKCKNIGWIETNLLENLPIEVVAKAK